MKKIFLVKPQERYAKGQEKMVNEYREYGEKEYFDMYKEAVNDFNGYVSKLNEKVKWIVLLECCVPQCTYCLTNMEDDILGIVRIRTSLNNEFVRNFIGHIGYNISVSYTHLRAHETRHD